MFTGNIIINLQRERLKMEFTLDHYLAKVTSVYNGNTFTADIAFGLLAWVNVEKSDRTE